MSFDNLRHYALMAMLHRFIPVSFYFSFWPWLYSLSECDESLTIQLKQQVRHAWKFWTVKHEKHDQKVNWKKDQLIALWINESGRQKTNPADSREVTAIDSHNLGLDWRTAKKNLILPYILSASFELPLLTKYILLLPSERIQRFES